jgi:transposase-like protein
VSETILHVNEELVKSELREMVRKSVEETLNALLDAEAEEMLSAGRCERTAERQGYRAGHCERKPATSSGEAEIKTPKLKGMQFQTAIIERYQRRESSVEEALIEMYLAGVSVRRVEDISEALWGSRVSASTVSELNQKAYINIEEWRNAPIEGEHPYVYADGIWLKRSWGGEYEAVSVPVAVGVDLEGRHRILGAMEGMREDKASWESFFSWMRGRGLKGVRLLVGDKRAGLEEAAAEILGAKYQRCIVHFYRNVMSVVPRKRMEEAMLMVKAIHAQESKEASLRKAAEVAASLREKKLPEAAKKVEESAAETLAYCSFPPAHWRQIRTTNIVERINREIRRRTRVVGAFLDGKSALMLVCARLRHVALKSWGDSRYMSMDRLLELERERKTE